MIIQVCSTQQSHYLQMTLRFFRNHTHSQWINTITESIFKAGSVSDSSYYITYHLAYGVAYQANEEIPQEFLNLFSAENAS